MTCNGPCLKHCYKKQNNNNIYLYIIIGIIIGIILTHLINYLKNSYSNDD